MMSARKAATYLVFLAVILSAAVPVAGILAETPWLMLPFVGIFVAGSMYLATIHNLGSIGTICQVLVLDTMYGAIFSPDNFGSSDASVYGGCAIALTLVVAFDNWIWPDPAEAELLESIAGSLRRIRERFLLATAYYLDEPGTKRPPEPPLSSEMAAQLALLDRASAEGISPHRRAALLAAITVKERLHFRTDRLILAARVPVPHEVRTLLRPELQAVRSAIADALEERAEEILVSVQAGMTMTLRPFAGVATVRSAMDALDARVVALRPSYINRASGPEVDNVGAFTESFDAMARLLERPIEEAPISYETHNQPAPTTKPDPALVQYCLKVAMCVVAGYVIGLTTQRGDLTTILTTIIVAGLPSYGATMRKAILRIVGALFGGAISLLAIMIATPNFSTLPAYMMVSFAVLFFSAYTALASGRVAYAGKQIGTTFILVYIGLSPSPDVYSPLWRAWGVLLGTVVVAVVFLLLWPVYAGDSLLPRLRKVLSDTLSLLPGGAVAAVGDVHRINQELTMVLSQILAVADDARMEGRQSTIDHEAVVQSSGTIRRIAHWLVTMAIWRLSEPPPRLDDETLAAEAAAFGAVRRRLESWLAFYQAGDFLSAAAARARAGSHSRNEIAQPAQEFINRIEADGFARISGWPIAQRRRIQNELECLRRLEFLLFELDTFLSHIPGVPPAPAAGYVAMPVAQPRT
jgi:Aluminium activated malate transporter